MIDWLVIALSELVLIAIHVDPDTVVEEMEALTEVHKSVARRWNTDNILLMGDFNADTRYISRKNLDGLKLRSATDIFSWLIGDEVDTTTADSDYTYDRCLPLLIFPRSILMDTTVLLQTGCHNHDMTSSSD